MDLKQFLNDLKNVNPKNPGGWPWAVKIAAFGAIFVAALAGGYFVDWQDQINIYNRDQVKETELKESFLNKKREAINLDLIKKQLLDTKESFSALLKQLPTKSQMDELLRDINEAGLGRGLLFDLFKPGPETVQGVLTVQPIAIKVEGNYDDLGKFASDVSQLSRIVTLHDIAINPQQQGGELSMEATARTYRYLDENELAAQRAAAAKGAKK